MKLVALAYIGKAGEPLYFFSVDQDDPGGEFNTQQLVLFSALDAVDERRKKAVASAPATFDLYLGQLLQMDDYKVFGHYSTTHIKTLVLCDSSTDANDASVREVIMNFRNTYANVVQNPFLNVEKGPLSSRRLHEEVSAAFAAFNGRVR
jgi:Sedlin, N-terminal conserved region